MPRAIRLFLLGLTLTLTACTLQFATAVEADGSGTQRVELGFTPEDQAALSAAGLSLETLCSSAGLPLVIPASAVTGLSTRGEDLWCTANLPFGSLEELGAALRDRPGLIVNQLGEQDGRFTFDVTVDLSRRMEIGSERHSPPDVVWQLSLPGILVGHNADLSEGNAMTWIVRRGEVRNLRAESVLDVPETPSLQTLALRVGGAACLCGLGALALGLVVWRLVSRSRRQG